MTHFLRQGNCYRVAPQNAIDLRPSLPVGTYTIKKDMQGLFLEQIDDFTMPAKMYGNVVNQTGRILNTFEQRPATTGILLVGEKGSGKSLLAKNLCIEAARRNYPTVVVNAPFVGEEFNQLLQLIEQPCIMLFDEFEKTYRDNDDQEAILTLLDGIYSSKKLFIFTSNDKFRINEHMRNRPGRIFYMLEYEGLTKEFIEEYCNDVLINKARTERVVQVAQVFSQFNFDMLKALVEEVNRYNEDPVESVRWLNIKPEYSPKMLFETTYVIAGVVQEHHIPSENTVYGRPLMDYVDVKLKRTVDKEEDSDGWVWDYYDLDPSNVVQVDVKNGSYVYRIDDATITLKRKETERQDYWRAF